MKVSCACLLAQVYPSHVDFQIGILYLQDTAEVLVFHPHGFLPRVDYTGNYSDQPIILSEDDYHQLYASPYSWPNVIQLNLLMSFSALFVGCSLTDPNMRRLLDVL